MKKLLALTIWLCLFLTACGNDTSNNDSSFSSINGVTNNSTAANATSSGSFSVPGVTDEIPNITPGGLIENAGSGDINGIIFIPDDRDEQEQQEQGIPNADSECDDAGLFNPQKEHKDKNDDGKCDGCGESVIVAIDFFAVNDLHGKFDDTDSQGGVDEMTTYFKNAKKENDHVVLLSSGDMWQGSAESNTTKGKIITDWMNELDFVSMTLGNHEYDWGEAAIKENDKVADFPFLAINVYDKATNKRVSYADPSVIVERGGVKIGIIGAIGDCYSSIAPEQVKGIYFKVGTELTELVKQESQRLKNAGADIIVYSIHDGYGKGSNGISQITNRNLESYYDIVLSEGYVDMVFEGHTHQKYTLYDSRGIYHMQAGGDNTGISHLEYGYNYITGTKKVNTAGYLSAGQYYDLEGDKIVQTLLNKYKDQLKEINSVVGYNPSYRTSSQLCNIVARLYMEKGVETWGNNYDIVLGGGFLKARSPYNLAAGDVKYSDLQMIFPFDNELVLCSISGEDLLDKFMNGRKNYYIKYSSYGESVKNNIRKDKTYYVIVDSYTSTYSWNNLTEIKRLGPNIYARDLLAEYFGTLKK